MSVAENRRRVEAAFDRCGPMLHRYVAVRVGGDTHLADDLLQQLWLQINRHGSGCERIADSELEYWFKAVARNLIRAEWRRRGSRPTTVPIASAELAAELADRFTSERLSPELLESKEVRDQLLLAITGLSNEEQVLIVGYYFCHRSHAALAGELGISKRAVEGRLYRARAALRDCLRELDPDGGLHS